MGVGVSRESALGSSDHVHASMLAQMTEGVVLQAPGGVILEWNPAAERLLGMTGDALRGQSSLDPRWRAVHPDGSPWPGETHPAMVCLETGEPVEHEVIGIHRPDGGLVWLEVSVRVISGPDEERRVLAVFTDVSDRLNLQDALRAKELEARAALDALDQGVVLVSRQGAIRANPACERILGFTAEQLTARFTSGKWETFDVDGQELPPRRRPMWRSFAGEQVVDELVGWNHADGRRILLRVSCSPDVDGQGNVVAAFTDVTEQYRTAAALARYEFFFQHASDLIVVIDRQGYVIDASPSVERILGYPAGSVPVERIETLVHPDDIPVGLVQLKSIIAEDHTSTPFTIRVRTYAGAWRHLEFSGVNLLEEEAVRGVVFTGRDVTDRIELTKQLEHLAGHDPLTGLANRSTLQANLTQALDAADQANASIGLCFVDLDGFKAVNDSAGHAVGDEVLVEIASRLRAACRSGDTAARVGGDEFVVVLAPISDVAHLDQVARRLHEAMAHPPVLPEGAMVGASVGAVLARPGETAASLLTRADRALYEAKAARDASVVLADDPGPTPT